MRCFGHRLALRVGLGLAVGLLMAAPVALAINSAYFFDVTNPPYDDEIVTDIDLFSTRGITNGCAPGYFCPEGTVSRWQLAAFLARALDLPTAQAQNAYAAFDGTRLNPTGDGLYVTAGSGNNGLKVDGGLNGVVATAYDVDGYGVLGQVTQGENAAGVYGSGQGENTQGVVGVANSGPNAIGVWGVSANGYAGYFDGNVTVNGTLNKSAGAFKIDHPLDPANKYLQHSFVESPDMKNVYDGVATTDASGNATVTLPGYFGALNRDFRYQLTTVGQPAQAWVATEIANNAFTIKTDRPNVKVSWQVTGVRQDPYAKAHPILAESDKPPAERGYYLHPDLYGQPATKGVEWIRHPQQVKRMQQPAPIPPRPKPAATPARPAPVR